MYEYEIYSTTRNKKFEAKFMAINKKRAKELFRDVVFNKLRDSGMTTEQATKELENTEWFSTLKIRKVK